MKTKVWLARVLMNCLLGKFGTTQNILIHKRL